MNLFAAALLLVIVTRSDAGFLSPPSFYHPYFLSHGASITSFASPYIHSFGNHFFQPIVYTHPQPLVKTFLPSPPVFYQQPQFFTLPSPKFYTLPSVDAISQPSGGYESPSAPGNYDKSGAQQPPSGYSETEPGSRHQEGIQLSGSGPDPTKDFGDDFQENRESVAIDANRAQNDKPFRSFIVNRDNSVRDPDSERGVSSLPARGY